ncbi:hypothetical protein B0J12DRAFT_710479 [Macrophomina phaseolina]|uniref:LYC1 C-terminal domain-containing protein n=1 Tax=Macrophomina phaseolina TaxID=35725 RepID=A0ABQ8GDX1_9PEZI|nr:hypothetical protein B0J12DRAFT_710479 [Macrophomina phaseolina]
MNAMDSSIDHEFLPAADSLDLHLSHLTPDECVKIWTITSDFRKHCLTSETKANVQDSIVHGIASVFCPPEYRGRGYAVRRMKEMAKALRDWQSECGRTVGSILYSDIRMSFYSKLGWLPNDTNSHMVFGLLGSSNPCSANEVPLKYVEGSVEGTRRIIRKAMNIPAAAMMRIIILPGLDHMIWQIIKEAIIPRAEGSIAGSPGCQTKIRPCLQPMMRHYVEQTECWTAVVQAAQKEATESKLGSVRLWGPEPLAVEMTRRSSIRYSMMERKNDSIASNLWYDEGGWPSPAPMWLNNEHYARR